MILDDDDASAALSSIMDNGFLVDGFDGEWIQHTSVHTGFLQLGGGIEGFVQSHSGADQQNGVVGRLLHNLGFADLSIKFVNCVYWLVHNFLTHKISIINNNAS